MHIPPPIGVCPSTHLLISTHTYILHRLYLSGGYAILPRPVGTSMVCIPPGTAGIRSTDNEVPPLRNAWPRAWVGVKSGWLTEGPKHGNRG